MKASELLARANQIKEETTAIQSYWSQFLPNTNTPDATQCKAWLDKYPLESIAAGLDAMIIAYNRRRSDGKPMDAREAMAYASGCMKKIRANLSDELRQKRSDAGKLGNEKRWGDNTQESTSLQHGCGTDAETVATVCDTVATVCDPFATSCDAVATVCDNLRPVCDDLRPYTYSNNSNSNSASVSVSDYMYSYDSLRSSHTYIPEAETKPTPQASLPEPETKPTPTPTTHLEPVYVNGHHIGTRRVEDEAPAPAPAPRPKLGRKPVCLDCGEPQTKGHECIVN